MCDEQETDIFSIPPAIILLVRNRKAIFDHVVIPVIQEDEFSIENVGDESDETPTRTGIQTDSRSVFITEKYVPILPLKLNAYVAAAFRSELVKSQTYRHLVWKYFAIEILSTNSPLIVAQIRLEYPKRDIIDHDCCYRVQKLVYERIELDYIMSWLSTLGGAFSSLGDRSILCAQTAGKISLQQFKIALKLGDDATVMRCRLYLSISLIQCKRLKAARCLIKHLYDEIKSHPEKYHDKRLTSMCLGIWAKLKYEWQQMRYRRARRCISLS